MYNIGMIKVIPAVLPKSFQELTNGLGHVRGVSRMVQIDVVDGVFAKNKTWPYYSGGREEFEHIIAGESGLPLWEDYDFQIDLMVGHSVRDAFDWVAAGASSIIIHAASPDAQAAIDQLQDNRMGEFKVDLGLAVASDYDASLLAPYIDSIDFVQVMGISNIGEQGQPFDERSLRTIKDIHEKYPELLIQVDGGVNLSTASRFADAGAVRLVAGSALIKATDPKAVAQELASA